LQETLQHPATLLPAALAAVAALWSAAIDLSPASLMAMLGFGFVSVGAWVINYVGRGDTLVEQRIQKLRALRVAYERREVEGLALACRQAGFLAGAKEAQELTAAYHKLHHVLGEQQVGQGNASRERFSVLAEETYRYGVAILQHALNLFQALQRIDVDTLERERQAWIRQRAQEGASESLERNIEAHTKRLDRYHQREEELRTLIAQLNELETALETAHLEIVDLVGQAASSGPLASSAASHLERAVEAARRVEQRLRGFGDEDTRADEQYLEV
jgi:C4-dicarboxylate-specific signal transduction histidine kinase